MSDGIRVNLSEQEAKSQDREPLPKGKFHYKFTYMEIMFVRDTDAQGNPNRNAGKPYFNFELTVQDGKYAGRKDWVNAMCFDGALYTMAQILKALGQDIPSSGGFTIPDSFDFYRGKDIWGRRDIQRDRNKQPVLDASGEPRIQLQGFSKYEGGTSTPSDGGGQGGKDTNTVKTSASVLP